MVWYVFGRIVLRQMTLQKWHFIPRFSVQQKKIVAKITVGFSMINFATFYRAKAKNLPDTITTSKGAKLFAHQEPVPGKMMQCIVK